MPSFAKIFSFAAATFAGFACAAPLVGVGAAVATAADVHVRNVAHVGAIAGLGAGVAIARDTDLPSVPEILNDAITKLTPLVVELGSITYANATVSVVQPITDAISTVLNDAIKDVNALAGQSVDVILATVDGVVDVSGVATLLANVLNLVFHVLGAVLTIIGSVKGDVFNLLTGVGILVGQLLQVVLTVVGGILGGLLAALLPLVGGVISTAGSLSVDQVVSILSAQVV